MPSRTEITESAHKVASALAGIDEPQALKVFMGGTRVRWTDYGKFSIEVRDSEAPFFIRGRVFHADFEAEHFHYEDLPQESPARRALRAIRHADPVGRQRRSEESVRNRLPVPDYVAEELAKYLRPPEAR